MTDPNDVPVNRVICGDAIKTLKRWPDGRIDMCLCSPPYWALRDYGVRGQLGQERSPGEYLERLLAVFDEVRRVLKPSGTCWVVLGDTYSGSGHQWTVNGRCSNRHFKSASSARMAGSRDSTLRGVDTQGKHSIPRKSLCLNPERFAIGMVDRGWILRNHIVWHKPNHMPSPMTDRLTCSWEHVFFFSKQQRYHFDLDAIREPHKTAISKSPKRRDARMPPKIGSIIHRRRIPKGHEPGAFHPKGKNPGDYWAQARGVDDCWSISTRPFVGAHFAVYPEPLCERPIKAGCPENGIVLDPFCGAGTTLIVARKHSRQFVGIDLNRDYVNMARQRLRLIRSPPSTTAR